MSNLTLNMAVPKVKLSDLQMEQGIMIKPLNFEGVPPKEIHRRLRNFYEMHRGEVTSVRRIRKWYREFSAGRKRVQDEAKSSRPRTVRTPYYMSRIKHLTPPLTISLSDRAGHFFSIRFLTRSTSDHTTVSQTEFSSFFFQTHFQP